MTLIPTPEQQQCINLFNSGTDIIINAFAGAGKTSTLVMLANNSIKKGRGLYVAFNRSIVKEAEKKLPSNIKCSTIDALAKNGLKHYDLQTKIFNHGNFNLKKHHVKYFFKELKKYNYYSAHNSEGDYENVYLDEDDIFELIFQTILNYFKSDSKKLLPKHVPILGEMIGLKNQEITCHLKIYITKLAINYVYDAFDSHSSTPFGFEGAVKLWALGNPTLPYNFVLLDEAQDTNPVFANVLKFQNCQKIIVGDKYQQIYSWRGAVNAMDKFDIKNTIYLTKSFRFGSVIADFASSILLLLNERHNVIGCGPEWENHYNRIPDAYLCRTNAGVIEVLIDLLAKGIVPVVPENIKKLLNKIRELDKILKGKKSNHPLFMGISSFQQLQNLAMAEKNSELEMYVKLIEKFSINTIFSVLSKYTIPKYGPTVTTIHKSKGSEWDFVHIHDDFPSLRQNNGIFYISTELLNLIYVAITRAKKSLTFENWLTDYLNIIKQNRRFQLQVPSDTLNCQGFCHKCSLVTSDTAYYYDEIN